MINFFYVLITLVIALFFIGLGLIGVLIQASSNIRADVITFILEDHLFILISAIASLLIGAAIIFYVITGFGKRYHQIKSDKGSFYLDESLFEDYMKNYWKQLFPKQEVPNHVLVKKNKVQITADLPYVPENQQKALLARIDRDLKDIFHRLLGYKQEYVISISFQSEPLETVPTSASE